MKDVPCLCCGEPMEVGLTKPNGKPFATCQPCGAQMFIRGRAGIEKFNAKYGAAAPKPEAKPEPEAPPPAKGGKGDDNFWD